VTPDGRIQVPADLDAVTAVGEEDHSAIDPASVERIWQSARHWYQAGMHPAIQLCLRRNGRVVLNRAIGHGWGNAPDDPPDSEKVPVTTETPFCAYSAAKAITTTVVHMLVERGCFSLDDHVCDYLPGYTSHGKDRTTIRHVMTHSAGVPFPTGPRPDVERMNDSEYAREKLGELKPLYRPGLVHIYHALTWGPLVREIVSAATGKNIRDILATEILDPLGFRWTNYGVAEQDVPLVAPSHATGKPLPAPIAAAFRTVKDGSGQTPGAGAGEWIVFRVTDVTVPPVDLASDDIKKLKESLRSSMTDEQIGQYVTKLETEIGTSINQAAFAQVTGANN